MDFRLSCNLLKGAVDSWTEVRRYMEFFGGCGITSFLFREVIPPKKSADVSIAAVRGKAGETDQALQGKALCPRGKGRGAGRKGFDHIFDL